MPVRTRPAGRLGSGRAATILAALLACAPLFSAVAADVSAGPPPGQARIWLYRDYQPYLSLARPYVRFNGGIIGFSEPGGTFYRDVTPGRYNITVDSEGRDVNQFARVTVAAGQQIYVEVDALRLSNCGVGARGGACRPTFYTRLQPPQVAASAIENSRFYGGK